VIPLPAGLTLNIAKIVLPALLSAVVAANCTGKHYKLKIENIELQYTAAAKAQEAENAKQLARQEAVASEMAADLQARVAQLDSRYRDAAARLHAKASASRALPAPAASPAVPAGAAEGNGLPVGSGTLAAVVVEAEPLLAMPVDGTVELLRQCDLNTQKLQGWQLWYNTIGEPHDNP